MFDGLTDWVVDIVETLGYAGVTGLVALENLFPPIPSEVVLPLAGFASSTGRTSLWVMIVAAGLGSLIGAYLLYGIAAAVGPVRLRKLVTRYGKWFGLEVTDLDKSEEWFDRYAGRAVFVCRCIPLMRSLISIPAGFRRMSLMRFTVNTVAGSFIWNTALVGAGYLAGENWDRVGAPLEAVQWIVIAVIVAAVAWFAWRRIIRPRVSRGS